MRKNIEGIAIRKSGITMITLVITIIVALILLAAGIVTVSNAISDATMTAFAEDLNTIQDQIETYYLQNNEFPTEDPEEEAMSQEQIVSLASNQDKLETEMAENGDLNEDGELGAFYEVDMSKINVTRTVRGMKENGENDIYVVSASTMKVYYLKGLEVRNEVYFSLSSKIIKYARNQVEATVTQEYDSDILTVGSITAKKLRKNWTNKMGVTLTASLSSGESLYLQLAGTSSLKQLTTVNGNNTYTFDSLNDLKTKTTPAITDTEINNLNARVGKEKYIKVIKRNNSSDVDTLTIDLSNFDITPPSSLNNWTFEELSEENVARFSVTDAESGVKEVRYAYLNKYNENGIVENYYKGTTELEGAFLKARGKKASVASNGNVEIKIPKEIEGIEILVLDKADNWTLVTKSVATSFYIGTTLDTINSGGTGFKVAFNNSNGIYDFSLQVSVDGTNYTSAITKTPNTTKNTYSEYISDYKSGVNIQEYLYIKVMARDNSSSKNSKTRVIKYSINDGKSSSYVSNSVVDMVNGVPIPKGFVASSVEGENKKADGLVIYEGTSAVNNLNIEEARKTRNQFVWIPVEDMSTFDRLIPSSYDATTDTINWTSPAGSWQEKTTTSEYVDMKASIEKYGGFYIARYESGLPSTATKPSSRETSIQLVADGVKPVSIKDAYVWNYIPWGTTNNTTNTDKASIGSTDPIDGLAGDSTADGAVKASRSLYPDTERLSMYKLDNNLSNDTGVISTLCYAVCRTSTLKFLSDVINPSNNQPYIVSSSGMGWDRTSQWNYNNRDHKTGIDVGENALNKTKNIYDLSGNMREWLMESQNLNSGSGTYTRSFASSYYNGNSAGARSMQSPSIGNDTMGFRIMLYIK